MFGSGFLALICSIFLAIANAQSGSLVVNTFENVVHRGSIAEVGFSSSANTTITPVALSLAKGPSTNVVIVRELGTTTNSSTFQWYVALNDAIGEDYYYKISQQDEYNWAGPFQIAAQVPTSTPASLFTSTTSSAITSGSATGRPNPSDSNSQSSNKLAIGLGVGLGVSALALALIVVILVLRRRREPKQHHKGDDEVFAYYSGKSEIDGTAIEKDPGIYELNAEPEKQEVDGEAKIFEAEVRDAELEAPERAELEGDLKSKKTSET